MGCVSGRGRQSGVEVPQKGSEGGLGKRECVYESWRRVVRRSEIKSRESSSSSSWGVVKRGAEPCRGYGSEPTGRESWFASKRIGPISSLLFGHIRIRPFSAQILFVHNSLSHTQSSIFSPVQGLSPGITPTTIAHHSLCISSVHFSATIFSTVCSRDRAEFSKQWTPYSAHSFLLHDAAAHRPPWLELHQSNQDHLPSRIYLRIQLSHIFIYVGSIFPRSLASAECPNTEMTWNLQYLEAIGILVGPIVFCSAVETWSIYTHHY